MAASLCYEEAPWSVCVTLNFKTRIIIAKALSGILVDPLRTHTAGAWVINGRLCKNASRAALSAR